MELLKKGIDFTSLSKVEKDFIRDYTYPIKIYLGQRSPNKSIHSVVIDEYGIGIRIEDLRQVNLLKIPAKLGCYSNSISMVYVESFPDTKEVLEIYFQCNISKKRVLKLF